MFVGSINVKIRNLIFTEKSLFSERNIFTYPYILFRRYVK